MKITLNSGKSVFVDGFHEAINTVYEFMGCNFHGCLKCHPHRRHISRYCHPDRTVDEVYEETPQKIDQLKASGFNVKVKWECEYLKERKEHPPLKQFVQSFDLIEPLEPRDAFFGGQTEATTLYAKTKEDETIADIIFQPEDQNIHHYFGIAKVDVLPPERLYHPVLPVRQHGKLTFPLCSACVTEEMAKPMAERSNLCGHTPQQRIFRGTWVTLELQKAVEKGYKIIKIHEVFHFPPHQRREGLFAEYVNTFLKVKQEAAGWLEGCNTDQQKAEYLREYEEKEGIRLENVAENPGRKAIAKLLLNR